VTYGIVTDHAGMIEVESAVQQGSTFTVWLPLEETT
jgi:signal transduction histidine kinase